MYEPQLITQDTLSTEIWLRETTQPQTLESSLLSQCCIHQFPLLEIITKLSLVNSYGIMLQDSLIDYMYLAKLK
jgi:hypothetical protein